MTTMLQTSDMKNATNAFPNGFKATVVAGAATDTDIAVTGIATTDVLMLVLQLDRDSTAANINMADLTSEATISSAGNIQLATTTTTGDKLLVLWWDKA